MAEFPREIRGVMVPVTDGRVLLPNATVAEVISYTTPDPIAGAPAWLLGRLSWRGWRLPVGHGWRPSDKAGLVRWLRTPPKQG